MTPETQGFAVGVLVCLFGWALIRLAALTIDHQRTEHAAAQLDREHPPTSDEDWYAEIDQAIDNVATPDQPRRLDVAYVPLFRPGSRRSVPAQREASDR